MNDRVAAARARRGDLWPRRFAAAGLEHPACTVLLRAFKRERVLEVWAGDGKVSSARFSKVGEYPILGASGVLGPKRREGDRQVPEGFYRVDRFNPRSRFHLSLGLDYPNAADRRLTTNPAAPGSDIFLHGRTESRGCLAMGDPAMEEIYLIARDAAETLVHLFPCRLEENTCRQVLQPLADRDATLAAFWRELRLVYRFFEDQRRLPMIRVDADGRYVQSSGL